VCAPGRKGMNDSERNQGSGGARAASAEAAGASPAPSRAAPASSASSAAGNNNTSNSNKRKDNPAAPARPAPPAATNDGAAGPAKKKAKASVKGSGGDADIEKEVRELLEKKLMGAAADDAAAKVKALRTLNEYWDYDDSGEKSNAEYEEHRRATVESDGCHLVLIVLRQELDKGDGANREVVKESVLFLNYWNCFEDELGETMLRFGGVEAVARAMQNLPHERHIHYLAVVCFYNFATKGGAARPRALVKGGCLPLILQALPTIGFYKKGPMCAVMTLGRMCKVAGPRHFEGLVDTAVLGTLVDVCRAYNEDSDETVRALCRAVMNKLLAYNGWCSSKHRAQKEEGRDRLDFIFVAKQDLGSM
jgi:hypothetical protein